METNIVTGIKDHPVVSHEEWLAARTAFLAREKEFSRRRDEINRQRRELPWERVDKQYIFDGPGGKVTLAELFNNKSQLIVYHLMFNPEWDEACKNCSFWADHFDSLRYHLKQRDTAFAAISRAPMAKIEPFKKRMGWNFNWVSSFNNDFNYDFQASFKPEQLRTGRVFYNYETAAADPDSEDREGASVFYKDKNGAIFHTYSCYARGIDLLNTTYNFLDLTPKGRDEAPGESLDWVEYHDRYAE